MQVRIVEPGHDEVSFKVDDLGVGSLQLLEFNRFANRLNTVAAYRNSLHAQNRAERRISGHARINIRVHENDVRLRRGRSSCSRSGTLRCTWHAHGSEQTYGNYETPVPSHHSPTPASANMVSNMRFNPNSRPLESNHSCKVCAPPPDPPPPMAIASCPSDRGIFASVDALCTWAAFVNCASTARTTCKIRAPGRNSPAGRFPI